MHLNSFYDLNCTHNATKEPKLIRIWIKFYHKFHHSINSREHSTYLNSRIYSILRPNPIFLGTAQGPGFLKCLTKINLCTLQIIIISLCCCIGLSSCYWEFNSPFELRLFLHCFLLCLLTPNTPLIHTSFTYRKLNKDEFQKYFCVLSTYPKKTFRTEKPSIFNFLYIKEAEFGI